MEPRIGLLYTNKLMKKEFINMEPRIEVLFYILNHWWRKRWKTWNPELKSRLIY